MWNVDHFSNHSNRGSHGTRRLAMNTDSPEFADLTAFKRDLLCVKNGLEEPKGLKFEVDARSNGYRVTDCGVAHPGSRRNWETPALIGESPDSKSGVRKDETDNIEFTKSGLSDKNREMRKYLALPITALKRRYWMISPTSFGNSNIYVV